MTAILLSYNFLCKKSHFTWTNRNFYKGNSGRARSRSTELIIINPFIPKSDQYQISPVASQEILHHTVWRTWLFIAYSDARWLYYQLSLPSVIQLSLQGWENAVFELGSGRVKRPFVYLVKLWYSVHGDFLQTRVHHLWQCICDTLRLFQCKSFK